MEQGRILVVDDEPSVCRSLEAYLTREGYHVEIATDGPSALELAGRACPDLVILDVILPGMDGFEVCSRLRRESDAPILMLTARSEEADVVVGLAVGADDYVRKPFSPREVVARVEAILRRSRPGGSASRWRFPAFTVDFERRAVTVHGRRLDLSPREFDVLRTLVRRPGKVWSREEILEQVWERSDVGDPRVVDVYVAQLRRKLRDAGAGPGCIETVRGFGYRFCPGA